MANRCTGACCDGMIVTERVHGQRLDPILVDKLRARAGLPPLDLEKAQIARMLVMDVPQPSYADGFKGNIAYHCRFFDAASRNCTIYDARPKMCRDHGITYKCNFPGCEWDGALHVDGRGGRDGRSADVNG